MQDSESRLITFVIPSFKDWRIIETIESIHAIGIDRGDYEIIVKDGGSDEKLLTAVRGVLGAHDKLDDAPDTGIFDGINQGLRLATGFYILTLGSDDRVLDLPIERLRYCREQSVDLVVCSIQYTDENWQPRRLWKSRKLSFGAYLLGRQYAHFGLVCKKAVYEDMGYFNTANPVNADYEFFYDLTSNIRKYRQAVLPNIVVQMKIGGNSSANIKAVTHANFRIARYLLNKNPFALVGLMLKPIYKIEEYVRVLLIRS